MFSLSRRTRKFIGTIVLVVFLTIYCLTVMVFGATRVPDASVLMQTVFFVVGGLLWVIPAMAIVWWMQRPDRER